MDVSQLREGYSELDLQVDNHVLAVQLKANQYKLSELSQYEIILGGDLYFFEGKVSEASEERLHITYPLGEHAQSLREVAESLAMVDRLILAQKLQFLSQYPDTLIRPYIHPDNLFVIGESVKVGHRGFSQSVMPYSEHEKNYFETYRAVILYLLNPKLNFIDLVNGAGALKTPFSQEVQHAENFARLNEALDNQVAIQSKKRATENAYVPKQRFKIYKWGMILFAVLTIGLAIATGIYALHTVPYKDRLVTAEIHFTTNDYSKALDVLKKDDPRQMPKGTQYALAVSGIQQDTLTRQQKENILKNISMKSNENVLLYWIYIGFGDFDKTLDVAQNIGDNQLILHAYRKLYNHVSADTKMKGSEKQEKLKEYQEQIQSYEEMLEGTGENEGQ